MGQGAIAVTAPPLFTFLSFCSLAPSHTYHSSLFCLFLSLSFRPFLCLTHSPSPPLPFSSLYLSLSHPQGEGLGKIEEAQLEKPYGINDPGIFIETQTGTTANIVSMQTATG